jgi:hypothetical protein
VKKALLWSGLLLLLFFVNSSFALPLGATADIYLHPNDEQIGQRDDDFIGNSNIFNIYGHEWLDNQNLNIYLSWNLPGGFDLEGKYLNAMLGDVFIYDSSSTSLEYFVPLRDHDSVTKGQVYQVKTTKLSNDYYSGWSTSSYGDNEVVTANNTSGPLDYGASVTFNDNTGFYYNTIGIGFLDDYGFGGRDIRFAYTCGNDVHAPVPEPATMLLVGTGLIGLVGFGRKKLLKK